LNCNKKNLSTISSIIEVLKALQGTNRAKKLGTSWKSWPSDQKPRDIL